MMQSGKRRILLRAVLPTCPGLKWLGQFSVHGPHAFQGSNKATYGLREGGAGFHRNRPAAGKAKPTLSAGIVRRVRNADGGRTVARAVRQAYSGNVIASARHRAIRRSNTIGERKERDGIAVERGASSEAARTSAPASARSDRGCAVRQSD